MAIIQAQKVPQTHAEVSFDDIVMQFCYVYQQYTYAQAKKLPFKRILKMIRVAEREDAKRYDMLTRIVSAPHTDKGKGVKTMIQLLQKIIHGA